MKALTVFLLHKSVIIAFTFVYDTMKKSPQELIVLSKWFGNELWILSVHVYACKVLLVNLAAVIGVVFTLNIANLAPPTSLNFESVSDLIDYNTVDRGGSRISCSRGKPKKGRVATDAVAFRRKRMSKRKI